VEKAYQCEEFYSNYFSFSEKKILPLLFGILAKSEAESAAGYSSKGSAPPPRRV